MVVKLPNFTLGTTESQIAFPLEERTPETYIRHLNTRGSALISTVFVSALDPGATVTVNYYDFTAGESAGERFDLQGHGTISVAGNPPDRKLITRYHDKPQLEVIVSGGNATFSVYITGLAQSASDLDAALIFDGETFVQATNQAIPIACLSDSGTLEFAECTADGIKVDGNFTESGITSPSNATVTFPVADTEQSYALPANAKRFELINESGACIKFSYQSGDSGTNYVRLIPGAVYTSPDKPMDIASLTLYWQADRVVSGTDALKVVSWL